MNKFELREGDLYFGDHGIGRSLEDTGDAQDFLDTKLNQFFGNGLEYKEYIDLYGKIHGLDRYALLAAHGDTNDKWVYFDGEKEYAVQSWINKFDGKYSALLLCVCNPGNHTPKYKKFIIVVPDGIVNFSGAVRATIFDMLVPKIGEVTSYTIDYELKKLKR